MDCSEFSLQVNLEIWLKSMCSEKRIAIIGAGVIGTTTAARLQEQFGNDVSITIFSEKFSPETTGDIAAGLWGPTLLCDTPTEKIM